MCFIASQIDNLISRYIAIMLHDVECRRRMSEKCYVLKIMIRIRRRRINKAIVYVDPVHNIDAKHEAATLSVSKEKTYSCL